jgi:hypothetical protein
VTPHINETTYVETEMGQRMRMWMGMKNLPDELNHSHKIEIGHVKHLSRFE